ncbi:MAG: hypothetical protein LUC47_10005 [Clostridiales bacterium]|nr:hypothetical protein [Clostridiales bacterium]
MWEENLAAAPEIYENNSHMRDVIRMVYERFGSIDVVVSVKLCLSYMKDSKAPASSTAGTAVGIPPLLRRRPRRAGGSDL